MTSPGFTRRLTEKVEARGNLLCVGIDPRLEDPPPFLAADIEKRGPIAALNEQSLRLVRASADIAPAVKLQSAFFEAEGPGGFEALFEVAAEARRLGMLVVLDAKRGDISTTMKAYGKMAFACANADALTITPYMGMDVIEPLAPWLSEGRGVYVVWLSSNPGGALLQGDDLIGRLLDSLEETTARLGVAESLGLVLGATKAETMNATLWGKAARHPLLLPGIGPQGGSMGERMRTLLRKDVARVAPALIPMSRALAGFGDPKEKAALDALTSWDEYERYARAKVLAAAEAVRLA